MSDKLPKHNPIVRVWDKPDQPFPIRGKDAHLNSFELVERDAARYAHLRWLLSIDDATAAAMTSKMPGGPSETPQQVDALVDAQIAWLKEHHLEL